MLHQLLLLHSAFAEIGTMADKIRLDRLVELQGFAESRERAKAVIMSGAIYINGNRADKPGMMVPAGTTLPASIRLTTASVSFPYHFVRMICQK